MAATPTTPPPLSDIREGGAGPRVRDPSELLFGSELGLALRSEVFVGAAVRVEHVGGGVPGDGVLGLVGSLKDLLQGTQLVRGETRLTGGEEKENQ